jgi:hypothetical protein
MDPNMKAKRVMSGEPVFTYGHKEIAGHFGVGPGDLPPVVYELINKADFQYVKPDETTRDALILGALTELDKPLEIAGEHRYERWEAGWSENLEAFRRSGYNLSALIPRFVRHGAPVRMLGEYIQPLSLEFDVEYIRVLITWLLVRYFQDTSEIHEFGCGTAQNLIPAAHIYPGRPLFGYDWADASKSIITDIAQYYGFNMQGNVFDMFRPDSEVKLAPGSGVITIGSLEQLGTHFEAFLSFVLDNRPKIVVNVDTFNELYNPSLLLDELALRYDRKRGYLYGWVTRLRTLEQEGYLTILELRRTYGSRFHDGHSYVVWRPNFG